MGVQTIPETLAASTLPLRSTGRSWRQRPGDRGLRPSGGGPRIRGEGDGGEMLLTPPCRSPLVVRLVHNFGGIAIARSWSRTNVIRVELAPGLRGEDVVLLAMDGAGVNTFLTALIDAQHRGASQLEHDGVTHQFVILAGGADIELGGNHVVWRLDHAKAAEIVDALTAMSNDDRPSHNYVEISAPTHTLVLSRDEYVAS